MMIFNYRHQFKEKLMERQRKTARLTHTARLYSGAGESSTDAHRVSAEEKKQDTGTEGECQRQPHGQSVRMAVQEEIG